MICIIKKLLALSTLTSLLPTITFAQSPEFIAPDKSSIAAMFLAFSGLVFFLSRAWIGIVNVSLIEHESLASIEARKPYFPSFITIGIALLSTVILLAYLLKIVGGIAPFTGDRALQMLATIVGGYGIIWALCSYKWPYASQKYLFSFIVGTILTFALLACKQAILTQQINNPFIMAVAVVSVIAFWKLLFGPWQRTVKTSMLVTFIFWVGIHIISKKPPDDRFAYIITLCIALIPAVIWCALFLEYHKQRLSLVLLMFCAGMLSTAPILFYDALVRSGAQLNLFLFTITPESFIGTSNAFVSSTSTSIGSVQTRVLATLVAFLLVGLIEEGSKFWVLKNSGKQEFTSIDDVLQLAIVVAIGFAFAENVLNPSYFYGFVQQYLMGPTKDWGGFLGNVLGRSVLTSMVHIVSSGVLGYFYALTIFARPYLNDAHSEHKKLRGLHILQVITHLPERVVFKREMMLTGALLSIMLHGFFNFFVTLPDVLPENPQTLGAVLGLHSSSFTYNIALIMIPALLYVVGGFWVLSMLFYKKESIKERGHIIQVDAFIS